MKPMMMLLVVLLLVAPAISHAQGGQPGQLDGWPPEYINGDSFTCFPGPNCSQIAVGNQYFLVLSVSAFCEDSSLAYIVSPPSISNSVRVGLGPLGACTQDIFATLVGDYDAEWIYNKADTSNTITNVRIYYFVKENCWGVQLETTNTLETIPICGIVIDQSAWLVGPQN